MNWLAHVLLSRPDVEFRLGNLLADLVKGPEREAMSAAFIEGARHHQAIDGFTDRHAVVRRSRARIGSDHRYASGILVDVFYDHFLSIDWDRYSSEPLDAFTARVYGDVSSHPIELPRQAKIAVERMLEHDVLGSYQRLEGVETTLLRVSQRLSSRVGRELALEGGLADLVAGFEDLRGDFNAFFPELQAYSQERLAGIESSPKHGYSE